MGSEFSLKKYASIDELMLASIQDEENSLTIDDLNGMGIGGLTIDEKEVEFPCAKQKEGIVEMGLWGWIDEGRVIHYWIGKELPIQELIHFFAHEIGHRTGTQYVDDFQEEMRAEGYGFTAVLAYEFAKQIK